MSSAMPPIVPIDLSNDAQKVNAPQPDSERAAALKAEKARLAEAGRGPADLAEEAAKTTAEREKEVIEKNRDRE